MIEKDDNTVKAIVRELALYIDFADFKNESARAIDELCKQYLDVERLKIDGEFTNRLPEDFNLTVIEVVRDVFQTFLDEYDDTLMVASEAKRVLEKAEQLITDGMVDDKQTLIEALKFELNDSAKEYGTAPLFANREVLEQDYEEARKITVMEFFGGNVDDIFTFRNTMEEYVRAVCENMQFVKLSHLYRALAESL